MDRAISVVLIDDHALVRDGLAQILETAQDLVVVGQGGCSDDAVEICAARKPDVLILDVDIPGGSAVSTVRRVKEVSASTKVLMLSIDDQSETVRSLVEIGVQGYLLKTISGGELILAIRRVATASDQVTFSISKRSFEDLKAETQRLSLREVEVLKLAGLALSNAQIGKKLDISESTVKRHLYNVFRKLGAVSRVDAIAHGIRLGYIPRVSRY